MIYRRGGFHPIHGLAFIRVRGYFYKLKAPWNRPMFSERHGNPPLFRAFGWRILKVKVGESG